MGRKPGPKPKHSGVEAAQQANAIKVLNASLVRARESVAAQEAALLALQGLGDQDLVHAASVQATANARGQDDKTPRPSLHRRAPLRQDTEVKALVLKGPTPQAKRRQQTPLTPVEKGAIVCEILCMSDPRREAVAQRKKDICARDKTGRTTLKRISTILGHYNAWRESAENRVVNIQSIDWPTVYRGRGKPRKYGSCAQIAQVHVIWCC